MRTARARSKVAVQEIELEQTAERTVTLKLDFQPASEPPQEPEQVDRRRPSAVKAAIISWLEKQM
jgi:hypothetical protein